ncbi:phenylacetic acid degradation PaaB family protein [Haloparvum sp. PAK95]|uniref:phenylacetic acid degradation PaaB family protein n=1 Tax=Haloparvum sp. PAK95 TaxID=3418962 RepID=UPI003D2EF11E
MKYQVFARVNQGDDTIHIGNVTAKSDRLAKVYARNTFNEEDWDRLAVVRESNLLDVEGEARPTVEVSAE